MKTIHQIAAIGFSITALVLSTGTAVRAKESAPLADGDLELAHRLQSAFMKVADQASESVVVINSKRHLTGKEAAQDGSEEDQPRQFDGTPFEFFFRNHALPPQHPRDVETEGSGIIYRRDGYIVTNNHVVDGADSITVRMKDGKEYTAKLAGADTRTDIAVIKVDAKDLSAAQLGDSDSVHIGQWAIAIGSPYELDYSVTVGFVSAKERSATSRTSTVYEDYLQTDAAINPGNSGGPLCDIDGRVIGMNTLIRGLNRGIGFAIPANTVREISNELIASGRIVRPWLGIAIDPLSEYKELIEEANGLKDGVVVREIQPDTPAARSNLKQADIIVKVDGVSVKTPKELQLQVLHKKIGQTLTLDVVRAGKPVKVSILTAAMDDELRTAAHRLPATPKSESAFGLTVQTLTRDLAKQFGVSEGEGVVVTDVAEGSLAAEEQLQHSDIITEVNRVPVRNADEFKVAMGKADAKKGVLIFFKRDGASAFVVLKEAK